MKTNKEITWQELNKYLIKNCKVNDELLAINLDDLIKKFGTTKQNLSTMVSRICRKNEWIKNGTYIIIKIK